MQYEKCTWDGKFIEFHFEESHFTYWINYGSLFGDGIQDWIDHLSQKNWFTKKAKADFIEIINKLT